MLASKIERILRLRLWLMERFRLGETSITLFWAGIVGLCGGLLSVGFLNCVYALQRVLTDHSETNLIVIANDLNYWERVLIPTLGGLLAGGILYLGGRLLTRDKKTTDYMEAVLVGNGIIRLRDTAIKSLSSLFSIASGSSIGREGAMVTLSATFASWLGRARQVSTPRLRLMVACGAAAGIAAAYKTPVAGALFVAEIILGSIAMETFGPLVFSSFISTLVVYQLIGTTPTYLMPTVFHVGSNWDYLLFLLLGILAGVFSPMFLKMLHDGEELFHKLNLPLTVKLGIGGLIVGLVSIYAPEVWGNGYGVVGDFLRSDSLVWTWVLTIFLCKIFATSASVGSGAVGGVFTPTLFMGAAIGWLFGYGMNAIFPSLAITPAGFALVGMGCVLAASTQAVLMSIIMIFEMSLQYEVVLPLMLGCVTAYFVSKSLGQQSIYAKHLQNKQDANELLNKRALTVKDLLRRDPPCVPETASFGQTAQMFVGYRLNNLYVVDKDKKFLGIVSLHEMKPFLNDPNISQAVIVADIMRDDFPTLKVDQDLTQALQGFAKFDGERIPVINNDLDRTLLGFVSKTDLLLTLSAK
ncbi:MAG: ClcB-like voltage-gated chloride channel protein [Verrucomicrobiales bacterium]|jgi:CIC family chloride channel protein|nr:ClcB-like voltage-gated chloride channel protein [Verrucomicrobiales bacterium]